MTTEPKSKHIPRATIQRLAIYVQVLENLARDGVEVVSSNPLAESCGVNGSQVRKDLAYFGEFGVRGVGYRVDALIAAIKNALGVNREWRMALVGAGNLGRAILNHGEFRARGFNIVGVFDCDPFKIGEIMHGLEVRCTDDLPACAPELGIEMGIITTPPERAQRAANHIVEAGVTSILTFAPARIKVPEHVHVEYVDFFHHLYALAFAQTQGAHSQGGPRW
ncbi:MAG: redox-sensing transcriptional repressor Rex [Desulfovibrio sp.]|nr:redox-sensing transcriptional repressor Rex [Desulfovibrio sp.]